MVDVALHLLLDSTDALRLVSNFRDHGSWNFRLVVESGVIVLRADLILLAGVEQVLVPRFLLVRKLDHLLTEVRAFHHSTRTVLLAVFIQNGVV